MLSRAAEQQVSRAAGQQSRADGADGADGAGTAAAAGSTGATATATLT